MAHPVRDPQDQVDLRDPLVEQLDLQLRLDKDIPEQDLTVSENLSKISKISKCQRTNPPMPSTHVQVRTRCVNFTMYTNAQEAVCTTWLAEQEVR